MLIHRMGRVWQMGVMVKPMTAEKAIMTTTYLGHLSPFLKPRIWNISWAMPRTNSSAGATSRNRAMTREDRISMKVNIQGLLRATLVVMNHMQMRRMVPTFSRAKQISRQAMTKTTIQLPKACMPASWTPACCQELG